MNIKPGIAYTAVLPDRSHVTIRCREKAPDFAPDLPRETLVASYLSGPDNTAHYTGFAFVIPDAYSSYGLRPVVWKRHRDNPRLSLALQTVLGDPRAAAIAYARESGRCAVCGKLLTHPQSLADGIGPTCLSKL